MYNGCQGCAGCPQERNERTLDLPYEFGGFVLPVIKGLGRVLVVGDHAEAAELRRGEVFSGMTGYQWAKTLRQLGIERDEFSLANVISCAPPKEYNTKRYLADKVASVTQCKQYLHRTIATVKPEVILTVGELACNTFLGEGSLVEGHAPRRGYTYSRTFGDWVGLIIPTLHPRRLGQGKAAWTPLLMHDILTARKAVAAHGPAWVDYSPEYVEYANIPNIRDFIDRAKRFLLSDKCNRNLSMITADIETAESGRKEEADYDEIDDAEITRISFAYRPGYAVTIPWTPQFMSLIQEIFDLAFEYMVYWNWTFDHPRIIAKGVRVTHKIFDGMELWHYYKTALPKSLGSVTPNLSPQFAEWKSLFGVDVEFYSCVDSDAAISNVWRMIEKMPRTQLDAFLHHWIDVRPICQEMHEHGALMDMDAHDKLEKILITDLIEVDDSLQAIIPEEIKPFKFYKMVPINFRCRKCAGKGYIMKAKQKVRKKVVVKKWKEITPCEACEESGFLPDKIPVPWKHEVGGRAGYFVETSEDKRGDDGKWRKMWGFKQKFLPTSPFHVAAYLRHEDYAIPRNYNTDKETTDVKAIRDLMFKHPKDTVLPQFLTYRQIKKALGQYVYGYVPGDDGRIHTQFGQKAANLRFNSIKPNVQNINARGKYAQLIRRQFIPRPGYVLAELDHSGAEAQIVGYYANDPDYIRIAKLSIHGILASYVLVNDGTWTNPIDLKWSDEDINAAVDEINAQHPLVYAKAKNCVHGSNFGAVPYKLFMEYREAFPTLAFAEEIQEIYFGTIAKGVKQWHHDTWEFAHANKYIENVYGYRFDFWDVLSPNWYGDLEIDRRTGYWKLGDQAKDCLAFNPSSTEAGLMKEIMVWLHSNTNLLQWLVWMIHDSLVFELPDDGKLYGRLAVIADAMSHPVPQMGGLSIECGVDVGYNWGKRSADNPEGMTDWTKFKSAA
jgi:uracil-DNA glycosylase family 4